MRTVLLTGATGVLGFEILRQLSLSKSKVYTLVRARNESHLNVRKQKLLNRLNSPINEDQLKFLLGDVTKPNWGLSPSDLNEVLNETQYIIHSAGQVALNQTKSESYKNNVCPIEFLLQMTPLMKKLKKVDLVSTVGVGGRSTLLLPEHFLTKEPQFHNNYERGKWQSEKLISEAIKRGTPISVHRPSMIVGNSETGNIQDFQVFYYICEFITGRKTFGLLPSLRQRQLDIIPVDVVAKAIILISQEPNTVGQVFNLASGKKLSLRLDKLAKKITKVFDDKGVPTYKPITIPDSVVEKMVLAIEQPFVHNYNKTLFAIKHIIEYLFTDQNFENDNFKNFLENHQLSLPTVDSYLDKVINFYLEQRHRNAEEMLGHTEVFVREVQLIDFYRDHIWPIHRKFITHHLTPRCSKCAISSKISPLKKGVCKFCREPSLNKIVKRSKELTDQLDCQMEQLIHSRIGKAPKYDAIVLFSGGKDSVYMVYRLLRDWPNLRVLALTVDNTFLTPLAHENIKTTVQKLKVDHQVIRPNRNFIKKMFAYAFTHLNEEGCSGTVDRFDGDLIHDVARNLAAQLNVPFVFSGLSPSQAKLILNVNGFETSREFESQKRTHVANIKLTDIFGEDELQWWWDGSQRAKDLVPHMIFPFCAWNMSESEIKKSVVKVGLIQKGQQSPLLTNYRLSTLMGLVDMAHFGYSSFEAEFAANSRNGQGDFIYWRNTFEILEYAVRTGRFINESVDQILADLGLSRQDVKLPPKGKTYKFKIKHLIGSKI